MYPVLAHFLHSELLEESRPILGVCIGNDVSYEYPFLSHFYDQLIELFKQDLLISMISEPPSKSNGYSIYVVCTGGSNIYNPTSSNM